MKTLLHIRSILIINCLILIHHVLLAQPGCQDPAATNYNPAATSTNSSCTYSTTSPPLTQKIATFPATCNEASSLLFTDGKIFLNNDSGNTPVIYQIDSTTGAVIKATAISNYVNEDWEDLAADSLHLYIGDFGNNDGERTNLKVLKVKKSAVYNPDSSSIKAVAIKFKYPDQTSFAPSSTHNFDCESFFYHKGLLHLFSKNRGNKKTKHYTIDPNVATNQTAVLKDSLNVNGLITGATVRADGKVACLLGYDQSNFTVFSWLLFGYDSTDYFAGNRRRLELPGGLSWTQAEGIGFRDEYRLWISNEKLATATAKMRQMNVKPYLQSFFTENQTVMDGKQSLVWPNPVVQSIQIGKEVSQVHFWSAEGKEMHVIINQDSENQSISTENWSPGLYFVTGLRTGKSVSTKIIKE